MFCLFFIPGACYKNTQLYKKFHFTEIKAYVRQTDNVSKLLCWQKVNVKFCLVVTDTLLMLTTKKTVQGHPESMKKYLYLKMQVFVSILKYWMSFCLQRYLTITQIKLNGTEYSSPKLGPKHYVVIIMKSINNIPLNFVPNCYEIVF